MLLFDLSESIKCIEKQGWSKDLTRSKLNDMIKIFMGKGWGYVPSKTYIFVPHCPMLSTRGHVYVSGPKSYHAEDNMIAECDLPHLFYLTSAPCPDCAMKLYKEYQNHTMKPTIFIARPYQGRGKKGSTGNRKVNLHCLAMLMGDGFQIIPWDWYAFKDVYITNGKCKKLINKMINDKEKYIERYEGTIKHLKKTNDMIKKDDNLNICNTAAKFTMGNNFKQ